MVMQEEVGGVLKTTNAYSYFKAGPLFFVTLAATYGASREKSPFAKPGCVFNWGLETDYKTRDAVGVW